MPKVDPIEDERKPQVDKFRELARELGADEDEAAFKAKLVKIAKAPRQPVEKNLSGASLSRNPVWVRRGVAH